MRGKMGVPAASQPSLSHPSGTEPVPVSGKAGIANAEPRLSANERVMLKGMRYGTGCDDEPWCLTFKGIAERCELPAHLIRRTVRSLARKGLTEYAKGLWSDDGVPAGAGYTLTSEGRALAWKMFPRRSTKWEAREDWI